MRTTHSGMLAITIAATPEGTVCCAHETPPLPTPSMSTPVSAAKPHCVRSGRAERPAPPTSRAAA